MAGRSVDFSRHLRIRYASFLSALARPTYLPMNNPNEETSTLTRVPSETEAAIVIAALEDNGIKAESDEYTSGLRAGPWNWVDIMVATKDLARAQEVLAQVQQENADIDWSQVDVGESEEE
jgi:hypothetical protein